MVSSPVLASTPATLTVGVVVTPPSTWIQTPTNWGGQNSITQIPYLFCYEFGSSGVAQSELCHVPVAVAGSNDTEWVINLMSANYKWSDGVSINSTDLAFSYGIFLPTGAYANRSAFDVWGNIRGVVSSISIMNSTAIQLNMFKPDPLFTTLTWLYQIYPAHYYEQFTGNNTLQTTSILGGPGDTAYLPQGYTAGSTVMTLVANPSSPSWNGAAPTIQTVVLQMFTSDSALVNALAAGTVDAALVSPTDASTLSSVSSLTVSSVASDIQMQYFINPIGYPYNNTAFRQALMYLLPKDQINSLLFNNTASLGNPLLLSPQSYSTYWPGSSTPSYNYSTTSAVALLQQAGLTKNSAGNWAMKNGTVLTVQFVAPNNDPDIVRAAQQIQTSMQSIGLKVNLQVVDATTASNDKYNTPGNYYTILYPDGYFPSPFKWMRNPVNLPFEWSNSTFKADFAAAITNTNPAAALAELKIALNIEAESAITNSILYEPTYVAYNSQAFTNWQPALGNQASYDIFLNQVLGEQVLTSVTPISVGTSATSTSLTTTSTSLTTTSATSMSLTTTTTSTSSTTALSNAIVVPLVAVAAAMMLVGFGARKWTKRRPDSSQPPVLN